MDHGHGMALVFFRNGVFLVASHSYLACGAGGSVANGWVTTGTAEMGDDALGGMVRAAWRASECNVPMPDFSRPFPEAQKILEAAGLKSQRQFAKGNVSVDVERSGNTVVLLPSRNDGLSGYSQLPELAEEIDAHVDDAVLGHRVREALGRSR